MGTEEKKTVHDLKQEVDRLWRARGEGAATSPSHLAFWRRLNRLGWERRDVGVTNSFVAATTAVLSNSEYLQLLSEVPLGTGSMKPPENE